MNKAGIFAGPTSSFVEPTAPPSTEPDAAPLVCLSFNADWLPYVIGGLMQLAQRTTWAGDASAINTALDRVQILMSIFGTAGACDMVTWRFTDSCVLQFSDDGGATWTDTPGWSTFAPDCFTGPTGATGATGAAGATGAQGPPGLVAPPPTNPQGATTSQQACNIAAYLAQNILKASVQAVYDQVVAANSLFGTITDLIPLILAADFVFGLIVAAGSALYNIIQSSTLSDFTSALADAGLWSDIQCAIFLSIAADGYVTDGNFAAMRAAVNAISWPAADVQSAVMSYIDELGASGVEGLQNMGSTYIGDCSACGTFCYEWDDAGHASLNTNWAAYDPGIGPFAAFSGGIWESVNVGGDDVLYITLAVDPSRTLTDFSFVNNEGGGYTQSDLVRFYSGAVGSTVLLSLSANTWSGTLSGVETILISVTPGHPTSLSQITIRGLGNPSPWGADNCV